MDEAERIAAMLDGRLDERQRAEVLAHLDTSEAAFESFLDAAAVVREVDSSATRRVGIHRWRVPAAALAAAILVAAILFPAIYFQKQSQFGEPERFVALLASRSPLTADWNGTPWTTTRGTGEPLTDSARAIRLGARLTDLTLSIRTNDTSASPSATDIAILLDPIPGSAPVARVYRQIASPMHDVHGRDSLLALGAPLVAEIAGSRAVDLGAWIEAARIAAARHDDAFFRSAGSRGMMARLPTQVAITLSGPRDWSALQTQLTTLLAAAGA